MGQLIALKTTDGHSFHAWQELPEEAPLGSVIVLQEIFGVNSHVRNVCAQFAANGFAATAPQLFDRVGGNVEYAYDEAGVAGGRERIAQLRWEDTLLDVAAAAAYAQRYGSVGSVGYCWGGSLAWLCATRLGLPSVSYYGARSMPFIAELPQAPVIMHFGERDTLIPATYREAFALQHPAVPQYLYAAGHGFNCNERADFHQESAALAWRRTLGFFREHLGPAEEFHLHPRLQEDAIEVGDLPLCRLLLMNDARYPWVILVPRRTGAREIIDLDAADRSQLMDEIAAVSTAVRDMFEAEKLNVAALGNVVAQLHVHVVARYASDGAWPAPVWGVGTAEPYKTGQVHATLKSLREALSLL
jgi:carboxymethylenebutenolidase